MASAICPPPASLVWLCVAFVKLAMVGVTIVGLPDNTTLVVPVEDVTPVPPCATANGLSNVNDDNTAELPDDIY